MANIAGQEDTSGTAVSQEDLVQASSVWHNHRRQMLKISERTRITEAGDPLPLWRYVTEHKIISSAMKDMLPYSKVDIQGVIVPLLARCLAYGFAAARLIVERKMNKPADADALSLLANGIVPMIENWWDVSQGFIPHWLKEKTFDKTAEPFILIASDTISVGTYMQSHNGVWPENNLGPKLRNSIQLQEFILSFITLGQSETIWSAIETLFGLVSQAGMLLQGIPKAVPGGITTLSGSLQQLINRPNPKMPIMSVLIIRILLGSHVIRPLLAAQDDLIITIAQKSWSGYPKWEEDSLAHANHMLIIHFTTIIGLLSGKETQNDNSALRELLTECDLVSLIAKCLYIWGLKDAFADRNLPGADQTLTDRDYRLIDEELQQLCKREPQLLKNALMRDKNYLITLDQLRSSNGKNTKASVAVWERLGTTAGLQETVLRAEAIAARRAAAGGMVGCSWYKCTMYRQESDQLMHWCMGCKKVVYCGYFCKTRDWDEGHKDVCSNETTVAVRR